MDENQTNEIDFQKLKRRSVSGVAITATIQGASMIGGFVLSIFLSPKVFGIYTIVVATASFLAYFSDIGLAAALIQKNKNLTKDDLKTTFTIQESLVFLISILTFLLSPVIAKLRGFSFEELTLFRILIVSFILSSFKTIPSVLLERELDFGRLAIVQIAEVITFNLVVIVLAVSGWGISMFTAAVLLRSLVGFITIYLLKPWRPSFGFVSESAKKLISFGMPFQLNSLLALLKDQLFVMLMPFFVPLEAVGYIGWAKKWSEVPLRLIMDNIIRVTFPTFSRLQQHPEKLAKGIKKTLFVLMFIIIPVSLGMIFLIKPIIYLIPRYTKWEPALVSFYLFTIVSAVAGISSPLLNTLNALGKIKISLYFMIFWTVFVWLITPLMVRLIGFNGVALTAALMSLSTIAIIVITKKYVKFTLLPEIFPSLVSALVMMIVLAFLSYFIRYSLLTMTIAIIFAGIIYLAVYFLLFKKKIISEINYVKNLYRPSL